MKAITQMVKHLEKHKKNTMKNNGPMSWHAYDMKSTSRQLEDMEHEFAQRNETQEIMSPVNTIRGG
jgi:hypothetical protein